MAKKTKKPKAPARKPAKPPQKPARKPAARRSAPRNVVLPGMEQELNVRLNRFCENIAEIREELNEKRALEDEECRQAHDEMRRTDTRTHRWAGVELARVPGEEKLRVRTSKQATTAETEEQGTGQGVEGLPLSAEEEQAAAADLEG